MWLMSYAISVGAGEGGSGQWEVEEDGSGMLGGVLLMGVRVKLGRFDGKVSEPAKGDLSGVVDDDAPTVGLADGCSLRRRRFPSEEEPLTEREGAKGVEKTGGLTVVVVASDITASSSY